MNFFTHIEMSKILFENLKGKISLDKKSFIYGNVKPDITCKLLRTPHTLENYFLWVCKCVDNLMLSELTEQEYSVKLGEICHYTCDFFCQYHIEDKIFHKFKEHFVYEIKLHLELLKNSSKIDVMSNSNKSYKSIPFTIMEKRKEYSSMPSTMKKDIEYALSTTMCICEYISYYFHSRKFHINENETVCLKFPIAGGQ